MGEPVDAATLRDRRGRPRASRAGVAARPPGRRRADRPRRTRRVPCWRRSRGGLASRIPARAGRGRAARPPAGRARRSRRRRAPSSRSPHEAGGGRRVGADGRRPSATTSAASGSATGSPSSTPQRAGLHAPVAERAAMPFVAQHEPLAERELEGAAAVGQLHRAWREQVLERELGQQLGEQLAVDALPTFARQRADERARSRRPDSRPGVRSRGGAPAAPKD